MEAEARAHHLVVWMTAEARRFRLPARPLPGKVAPERTHAAVAEVRVPRNVGRPALDDSLGSTTQACSPLDNPLPSRPPALGEIPQFSVRSKHSGDAVVVEVRGETDAATAQELSEHLRALEDLVSALQKAWAAGGHLDLRSPPRSARRIFEPCATYPLSNHLLLGETSGSAPGAPRLPA